MINGERIKQARELRGMTQKHLAECVRVTQAAIAQLEGGFYPASDERIAAIAEQTELPISFFDKDSAPTFSLGSLLFCAHASTTRRERVTACRHAQLAYEIELSLHSGVSRVHVDFQRLAEDPAEASRLTRKALQLPPDQPIPHLLNILEHHGAVVLPMPALKKPEAFSLWAGETPILAISDGRPGDRLRLTCAHELGHLVMHFKRLMFKVDDNEADQFAAEFLMPARAMKRELTPPITLSLLARLKPRWKVPIRALMRRSRDLRIITERQYRYLIEQLSLKNWGEDEEPVTLRPEKPRGLRQLAEMRYGNPIDYDRLASDMSLTPKIVRAIVECCAPQKRKAHVGEEQDLPVRGRVVKLPRSRRN